MRSVANPIWINISFSPFLALYTRIWDVADYVIPAAENGAFFVATNVIITPNQTRGMLSFLNII